MSTTIRFERNALMGLAHLISEDSHCYVWCPIPGGRPMFQFDLASKDATSVVGAPEMPTHAAFERFVRERFRDED